MTQVSARLRTLRGVSFLNAYLIVVAHEFRAASQSTVDVLSNLFFTPLGYLLLLGGGVSGLAASTQRVPGQFQENLAFIVPGVIVLQALLPLSATMYRYQADRQWGLLALKLVQGINPIAYVAGVSTFPAVQLLLQVVIITVAAWLLGVSFAVTQISMLLLGGLMAAVTWASVGGILVFAIRKQIHRMVLVRVTSLPLVFSAPTFYSLEVMPDYMRMIALGNPVTYQVELMRGGASLDSGLAFGVSLAVLIVSMVTLAVLIAKTEPLPGADQGA